MFEPDEMTLQELYEEIKMSIFSLPEEELIAVARTVGLKVKPIKGGLFEVKTEKKQ